MSRIGKKEIFIPDNVHVKIVKKEIFVKGILGSLKQKISNQLKLNIVNNKLFITRFLDDKISKSLHGLYNVLIYNMIFGVSKGFKKKLELVGIGYRVHCDQNNILLMHLGFSHSVMIKLPKKVKISIDFSKEKNPIIIMSSCDKQLLGIIAHKIRSLRPPEPYKGKGIRYVGEQIRRKTGKSV
ncbi:50S ribosomal protein L6 [Blattabacterium cuenoti]|uniref:50S ribosomal protein L6 n=1 Tax=Blattabacterium cuenoti TaxID=1653831 RepID=UPI00163CBF3A|nr:50S ribosomal protein L6 [Blattabacterium cuenoti]